MPRTQGKTFGRTLEARFKAIVRLTGQRPCVRTAAFECMREAHRELLPREKRGGAGITPGLVVQIIDRAKTLLRQLDLIDADHDAAALEKLLALACRWLTRTYQPSKAGDDVRWEIEDFEQASAVLRSQVSNDDNAALVDEARRHDIGITPQQMRAALPVAWLAAAKDVLTTGKVRVAAVEGALDWFNLPSRRSLVAILLAKLRALDVIQCTDPRYGPGFARKYSIGGHSFALPFVISAMGDQRRQSEAALLAKYVEQNTYANGARLERVRLLAGLPAPDSQECLAVSHLPEVSRLILRVPDWHLLASVEALAADFRPKPMF